MTADPVPGQMRTAAMTPQAALDDEQRSLAVRPFTDDAARRWLEYRPRHRPGACIAELSGPARKAVFGDPAADQPWSWRFEGITSP